MRPRVNDATQAPGHRPWGSQPGIRSTPTWRKALGVFTAACIARRCLHPLAALRARTGPTSPEMLTDRAPAGQGQSPLNPLTPLARAVVVGRRGCSSAQWNCQNADAKLAKHTWD
ncbi:MAG: hypothetical protein ACPIOQ_17905 [Promethearchaeia archaeon]